MWERAKKGLRGLDLRIEDHDLLIKLLTSWRFEQSQQSGSHLWRKKRIDGSGELFRLELTQLVQRIGDFVDNLEWRYEVARISEKTYQCTTSIGWTDVRERGHFKSRPQRLGPDIFAQRGDLEVALRRRQKMNRDEPLSASARPASAMFGHFPERDE